MQDTEQIRAAARIRELQPNPVKGSFDLAHLREVHRRIFQDVQGYKPGELRLEGTWNKNRILEGHERGYLVSYSEDYKSKIDNKLSPLQDVKFWQRLDKDSFARAFSRLYADLDYLHPFTEGNSRTLREFTQQFAQTVGHDFRWLPTNQDQTSVDRNQLYVARDIEVLQRHTPGLTPEQSLGRHATGYEVEEFTHAVKNYLGEGRLESLLREKLGLAAQNTIAKPLEQAASAIKTPSAPNPYLAGKAQASAVPAKASTFAPSAPKMRL